jgi:hypothetical protein
LVVVATVAVVVAGWIARRFGGARRGSARNPYEGLRTQALTVRPSDIGLAVAPGDVWGAVMDMPVADATATVVAFADGAASIYLSSGGGFIGGMQHAAVKQAAHAFIATANRLSGSFTPVTAFPLPAKGQIRFYAHVGERVGMAEAEQQALETGRHALSSLYAAAHAIISAYRIVTNEPSR